VGGIVRTEAVQEHAQFLDVEGIERQQLLDSVDYGHGIGLDLVVRWSDGFGKVVHVGREGGLRIDQTLEAEAL